MQTRIFIIPGMSGTMADAFFFIQSITAQISVSHVYIPAAENSSSTGTLVVASQIMFIRTAGISLAVLVTPGISVSSVPSPEKDMDGST